ncbi:N-6 DNA methylase [Candidatus Obscuribacterales bacterium]|nr:N-6 DNA methylase [Candidatus Obscuribacterales bacterium]
MATKINYEQMIWALADFGRSKLSITEMVPVIAQFLAWGKLSAAGTLPTEFRLEQFGRIIGGPSVEPFIRVFSSLAEMESLGRNRKAFVSDTRALQNLGPTGLSKILDTLLMTGIFSSTTNYVEIFDALIEVRSDRSSEFISIIPNEVAMLMARLVGTGENDRIYCAYDGSLLLAVQAAKAGHQVFYEVTRISEWPLIANILCDINIETSFSDPIRSPAWVSAGELRQFDGAIGCPVWGEKRSRMDFDDFFNRFPDNTSNSEVIQTRHLLAHSNKRVAVAVPVGLLFRAAGGEQQFKESVVRNQWLKSVIVLPPGMLNRTQIQFAVLVFDKSEKQNSIFFMNVRGEEEFIEDRGRGKRRLTNIDRLIDLVNSPMDTICSRLVSADECAAQNFNLLSERYVQTSERQKLISYLEGKQTVPIKEIADILRAQAFGEIDESNGEDYLPDDFYEVSVSDIDGGLVRNAQKKIKIPMKHSYSAEELLLKAGDVLLSIKGRVGHVGLVTEDHAGNLLPGQMFVILRPKSKSIDAITLFRFLRSPVGQGLLEERTAGASIKMINTKDLSSLPIIIPSDRDRKEVRNVHKRALNLQQQISSLTDELRELETSLWSI